VFILVPRGCEPFGKRQELRPSFRLDFLSMHRVLVFSAIQIRQIPRKVREWRTSSVGPAQGAERIAWDENTSCCFEHRGTYAQQSSNSIIPLLLSLDASSPPISTSWSRCIFFVFPNNRKFLKEKKNSFPKGQEFYDLESIL